MIYIVSGNVRSGTSMMMHALSAGGLEVAYDTCRNNMNDAFGDEQYQPNKDGFFELNPKRYKGYWNPSEFEGKLIKVMAWGLPLMEPGAYKIVFMLRDPLEVEESYEAVFNKKLQDSTEMLRRSIAHVKNRRDVDITFLQYRDVVFNPNQKIAKLDWPIDVNKAASIIDPSKYRFRYEVLS